MSVSINAISSIPGTGNQVAATDGLAIAIGSTAQRLLGVRGAIRLNSTTNNFEATPDGITYYTFASATGPILSITGTANRITVSAGVNPVIDISAAYVGQTSITTLGTITTGVWNGTLIGLAFGGTNANLTASNGGIFYSTASAGAILAGTATARQMLQSGASAAPVWSTTAWPATSTINQLLYSSAANVISGLATANSATLVTTSGGVPVMSGTMTNGQIIIGSTGATPTAATLTALASSGVAITNGAASITIGTNGVLKSFQVFTTGTAATYTKPAGINNILVECLGGGGAGGGSASSAAGIAVGGGGGAGGYCRKLITGAAATYTYTVGAGGTPGTAGNNPGGNGGATTFSGGTLSAGGGGGGTGDAGSSTSHTTGGGFVAGGTSTGGDINVTGNGGTFGFTSLVAYGYSGAGGSTKFGPGAPGFPSVASATAGNSALANSGGGGAGAISANTAVNQAGGAGGSGLIVVWEFV